MPTHAQPLHRKDEIVAAVLALVARHGFDSVSVREVANAVSVSIGTIQHHFPTKDDLVAAAFEEVVARIRTRIAVNAGGDPRASLERSLTQLLPLDAERRHEAQVYLAFMARAASSPRLAAIQEATLAEVTRDLAEFLRVVRPELRAPDAVIVARALLALVDGMATHAVSRTKPPSAASQRAVFSRALSALVH